MHGYKFHQSSERMEYGPPVQMQFKCKKVQVTCHPQSTNINNHSETKKLYNCIPSQSQSDTGLSSRSFSCRPCPTSTDTYSTNHHVLSSPTPAPDPPARRANASLIPDTIEGVDPGLVRRQRLLRNHVPYQVPSTQNNHLGFPSPATGSPALDHRNPRLKALAGSLVAASISLQALGGTGCYLWPRNQGFGRSRSSPAA